jgi:hypothetical protein
MKIGESMILSFWEQFDKTFYGRNLKYRFNNKRINVSLSPTLSKASKQGQYYKGK